MLAYVFRRLVLMVPTLFGIAALCFGLIHLAPGDPALVKAGAAGSESAAAQDTSRLIERFRSEHLLDRSLPVQFAHYLGPFDLSARGHRWFGGDGSHPWNGLLVGDLGREYLRPSVDVAGELRRRLGVTLPLAAVSLLLAYLLAIPIGILGALRRGGPFDLASTALVFALYALPVFWVGVLLQMGFGATGLGWLPILGLHGPDAAQLSPLGRALDTARHGVLPVVCLTYGGLAYLSRQMRVGVLDAIGADYVRAARARGLPARLVVRRHVLRNSLLPVITLIGHVLPALVGGSILVETVFDLPGMGRYAYEALMNREYDAVMGTVLVSAVMTLIGLLISDVLYAVVDPRVRLP